MDTRARKRQHEVLEEEENLSDLILVDESTENSESAVDSEKAANNENPGIYTVE